MRQAASSWVNNSRDQILTFWSYDFHVLLFFQDVQKLLRVKGPFAKKAAKKRTPNGRKLRASVGLDHIIFDYSWISPRFRTGRGRRDTTDSIFFSTLLVRVRLFMMWNIETTGEKAFVPSAEIFMTLSRNRKAEEILTKSLRLSDC